MTEPQLQGAFSVIFAWNGSGSPICYEGRIIWTFQNRWEIEKIPFRSRDIGCWLKKTYLSISQNFKRLNPKNELLFFSETLHTTLYLIEILPCKISHRNYKPFTTCKTFLTVGMHANFECISSNIVRRSPTTQAEHSNNIYCLANW